MATLSIATLLLAVAGPARATDLTTDPAGGDPNGPPPPPPPMPDPGTAGSPTAPPPPGSTAAVLAQASDEDTGVGLHFVYIQPELGFGVANLGSATSNGSGLGTSAGPAWGLGLGAEFITFQIGGRLRNIFTPNFNLWTVGGELAYQPGSGKFWPRIGLGVGYAWVNHTTTDWCHGNCDLVDVHGIDVGLRGGLQYFVTSTIEVGADVGLDALIMKRAATNVADQNFTSDGSGVGFAAVAVAHIGFHLP
jgi:hypothetical protein